MTEQTKKQIIVAANPAVQLATTFARYAIATIAGYLLARGLVSQETRDVLLSPETINLLVPLLIAGASAVAGMLKVKKNNAEAQTMANLLPDRVAKVE